TPSISLRGALAAQRGSFFVPIGGAVPPASWIGALGLSTALGRYAGSALRLDVRAGATGSAGDAGGLLHDRLGSDGALAGAADEAAGVGDRGSRSGALIGRARLGAAAGPSLRLDVAAQEGAFAGRARAVAAGAWAALPGDDLAYLAAAGWTGGAEISLPF